MISGIAAVVEKDGFGPTGSILLISPEEPKFWGIFSRSPEYLDGRVNPMDRWSKRVLNALAIETDARALFPSDGPPFAPFYTWAVRSGRFWASPISFLVHEKAGLFTSFRGALLVDDTISVANTPKPCSTCAAPCKTACPVNAFANGYDVDACKSHLATPEGADCMTQGCRARRACPVGAGKRLPSQAQFHMESFL